MEKVEARIEPIPTGEAGRYRFLESVSYFLYAVGPLVGNAVLALLGAIATDFAVDPTAVLTAIPAFMFPFAFFQLFSGAISDVYGRVRVMTGGLIAFAVGLLLTAYAASLDIFILGNVVCGVGFGFVNPVILALLSDTAAPEDISRRMGIASALASLSAGLGPFIAGQMVVLGWEAYYVMFFVVVTLGLIAMSVANRPARISRADLGPRVLIANMGIELRRPVVLLMVGATFLVALAYLGTLVWTSRALTGVLDVHLIGLLLLGAGVSGATAGSLLGPMARRWGFGLPIGLGFLALFGGLSVFILTGDITLASSTPLVGLALVTVGWAGGMLFPMMIAYSQMISPIRRGVLAGVVTSSFFLGSALIPTLYEPLFLVGTGAVYAGMLVVSVILLLFFIVLHRRLKTMDIEMKPEA
jgi:DHA1 family bicyclomycin/chloramphenicol resistance-like MFS transporter